jgi:hypothetical protein
LLKTIDFIEGTRVASKRCGRGLYIRVFGRSK